MPAIQTAVAPRNPAVYPVVFPPGAVRVNDKTEAPDDNRSPSARHRDLMAAIVAKKDRAAFAELFEFFAPRLKAYVMRIGADPSSAEELAQETMVTVWRKAATFDPSKAAVSTWIFTIARNRRIDQARRENRPAVDEHDLTGEVRWQESAFGDIQAAEEQAILTSAIESLPEEQAEVIRKAFYEDKSHAVVADELGLPLGTVKSRIRLALGHLKRTVSETLR
jgi:RNA polymerase sigma-70 factor (ECF subfamily)